MQTQNETRNDNVLPISNEASNVTISQKSDGQTIRQQVSLDIQYQGAWNEFNTRITQRQNLITIYTSLCITAIGVSFFSGTADTGFWRIIYSIPLLSILFAELLNMHEGMMGNLYNFMMSCEIHNSSGYHYEKQWSEIADKYRLKHDNVCAVLASGLNAIAVILIMSDANWGRMTDREHFVVVVLVLVAVYSIFRIFNIRKIRTHRV